jgi:hypothetical protein
VTPDDLAKKPPLDRRVWGEIMKLVEGSGGLIAAAHPTLEDAVTMALRELFNAGVETGIRAERQRIAARIFGMTGEQRAVQAAPNRPRGEPEAGEDQKTRH